ncbi:hypothetical protein BT93_F1821 [Corymbia citriodora subsp. variegata]|nr:hypothetical protein BT93_F1821 [Corymbia citriodora subsp. variegata]
MAEARRAYPLPIPMIPNRIFISGTKNPSATPSYPSLSQAEDFIPLPLSETTGSVSRPSRRRHMKLCTGKSSDSGSTGNYNAAAVSGPRSHHKRSRDAIGDDHLSGHRFLADHPYKRSKASPFLGHEAAFEVSGHESENDRLISLYTLEFTRTLKEKDQQIQKMQEELNCLVMENKFWKGLAQDNEFEADSLRAKLQRVLSSGGGGGGGWIDDEESSGGSNDDPRTAAVEGGDEAAESLTRRRRRRCGRCGKWEVGAVLLPRSTCACAPRAARLSAA